MMRHPFESLSPATYRTFYWLVLACTFVNSIVLQQMAAGFQPSVNDLGETYTIIDLEFARTPAQVEAIKDTWGPDGSIAAQRQTYADFPFLVFYSTAIALGVLAVVSGLPEGSKWLAAGRLLAWLQPLAGLLDAIENVGMIISLGADTVSAPWPQISFYCAAVKFVIVIAGILFVFIGLPLRIRETAAVR